MTLLKQADPVRWGIIGPGDIARNFAQGITESPYAVLTAVASRDAAKAAAFAEDFGAAQTYAEYTSLIAAEDVEAVYIATPHPFHAQLALDALRSGKHVVTEKPAGLIAGEVVVLTDAAKQQGRFFMEAVMYRCHPQIARVIEHIRAGAIGEVIEVEASLGFEAEFDPKTRLFDPALAGGAILDVGLYPVSLARLIAGVAVGQDVAEPTSVAGAGHLAPSGVDDEAHLLLGFASGMVARLATSIRRDLANDAVITGTKGTIRMSDPWTPGRNEGPSTTEIEIRDASGARSEIHGDERMLFAHEVDTASQSIRAGLIEAKAPAPSHADSIGNARVLDAWRQAVGYALPGETPSGLRRITGTMPKGLPEIPRSSIDGADTPLSTLILGCDNRNTLAEGALVWDAWWEAGGNAFDTSFVYGNGLHEALLGQWLKERGLAKEAQVVVKGAHSPYCLPQAIEAELDISLERLGLDRAPIYILHRDNPDIPAGEFVDALNALHAKGRIGAFGGSNWSPSRLVEANDHAVRNGLKPMTILNNNLSLAVMEKPLWEGCVTSNTPQTLDFLRDSKTAHFSWSAQARGYFLRAGEGTEVSEESRPDVCFASSDNEERRRRAKTLADERGVSMHAIATAWVLGQSFPSFALIGPRSPGELASTLAALPVNLDPADCAWLNLEQDDRPGQ
jgi:predicted dehydrogenase/aryl-alcohol dehydrogenase-like predicted oxidoreductase